jgi:hypothetical protein
MIHVLMCQLNLRNYIAEGSNGTPPEYKPHSAYRGETARQGMLK